MSANRPCGCGRCAEKRLSRRLKVVEDAMLDAEVEKIVDDRATTLRSLYEEGFTVDVESELVDTANYDDECFGRFCNTIRKRYSVDKERRAIYERSQARAQAAASPKLDKATFNRVVAHATKTGKSFGQAKAEVLGVGA